MALSPSSTLLAWCALTVPVAATQGSPPVQYEVHVLDSLSGYSEGQHEQAVAINASGEAVGTVVQDGRSVAAHWSKDGALTVLYSGAPGSSSFAFDLTDDGVAVGYSVLGDEVTAFRWSQSTGTLPLDLGPHAVPLAINGAHTIAYTYRSGQVLASALRDAGHGTTPISGGPLDVLVRDLNVHGAATGILGSSDPPARPFLWTPGGGTALLAIPPGFELAHGNALNSAGTVVGVSLGDGREQATRWSTGSAPALLPYARPAGKRSVAFGVNTQGWIVGTEHAEYGGSSDPTIIDVSVLWVDGVPYEMSSLVVTGGTGTPPRISVAWDINDQGQIAARGVVDGVERALRLDPQ